MPAGEQQVTHLVPVLRREQVRARALQVPQQRGAAASVTISTDSLVHRIELSKLLLSTIRRAASGRSAIVRNENRHVAGPHPDSRRAGAVRGPDHGGAAGRDDQAGPLVGHQRVDQRHRRLVDDLDHAVGCARGHRGRGQRPGRVGGALPGQRVRADHDRVAGHEGEQRLDEHGGDRVGRRGEREHHAGRARDLDHPGGRVGAGVT